MENPENIEYRETPFESVGGKKKPKKILKLLAYFIVFVFLVFVVFSVEAMLSDDSSEESWIDRLPIIGQLKHLAESAGKQLNGEEDDRINIVLLGMGGLGHDGSYLTDTIMLVSIKPSENRVAFVSIPRDLSIPVEGQGWRKINNINAYAEAQEPESGGKAVEQALGDIFNIPIHYYLRADFEGFVKIIDELGGIEVNVENRLEDFRYPIEGEEENPDYESRFEHLVVEKGSQKMDGSLALKYARSRHAAGAEGSDFARAKRQQLILEAIKEKALSLNTLFRPLAIKEIFNAIRDHVSTDLEFWEMTKLWDIAKNIDQNRTINKVLDNSANGLLYETSGDGGAYILLPKSGDFAEIQYFVKNIFFDAPRSEKNEVAAENPKIEVLNGTWINGLAGRKALDLEKYDFKISYVGNCGRQNFEQSKIYDLSYGEKINSLKVLKEKTDASVELGAPEWLAQEIKNRITAGASSEQADFILILGRDAN